MSGNPSLAAECAVCGVGRCELTFWRQQSLPTVPWGDRPLAVPESRRSTPQECCVAFSVRAALTSGFGGWRAPERQWLPGRLGMALAVGLLELRLLPLQLPARHLVNSPEYSGFCPNLEVPHLAM